MASIAVAEAKDLQNIIKAHNVVIFSKTYCQYSKRAKAVFDRLGQKYHAVELDVESNGASMQKGLEEMTGQRTVPNVFISGKHIGGSDQVVQLRDNGKLEQLLKDLRSKI